MYAEAPLGIKKAERKRIRPALCLVVSVFLTQ